MISIVHIRKTGTGWLKYYQTPFKAYRDAPKLSTLINYVYINVI